MLAITGAHVVTPQGVEEASLLLGGGRIVAVGGEIPRDVSCFDATGLVALPGFIDLHIHGGGGCDTMDATVDALHTICRTHARYGTTGLLATTMTQSNVAITAALANAATAPPCPDGARVLGIHLEGPYISPKKPGAQPKEYVRDYDPAEFAAWLRVSEGALRRITLASERPGATELMQACRAENIVISLGHTDASAAQVRDALEAGATDATHLFNAMNGIHHRTPGPVPVFLTDPRATVEVICDGHHVSPDVVRLIVAAKGTDGVIAITDAMAGAGASEVIYDLGGHTVTVKDGTALLPDGTLAGSVLTMAQAARNLRAWCQLDWRDIAKVTSGNAARRMGFSQKGAITPGNDADLVLVDDHLNVRATIIAGNIVYGD